MIEVRLFASLRNRTSTAEHVSDSGVVTVDVPDGITLGELLDEMEMNVEDVKQVVINGRNSDFERMLVDGDRVTLFPDSENGL